MQHQPGMRPVSQSPVLPTAGPVRIGAEDSQLMLLVRDVEKALAERLEADARPVSQIIGTMWCTIQTFTASLPSSFSPRNPFIFNFGVELLYFLKCILKLFHQAIVFFCGNLFRIVKCK